MLETLQKLPTTYLAGIIVLSIVLIKALSDTILWIFKEYWNESKENSERHSNALQANTMAIIKLQIQIEQLTELLTVVPKLREDVNYAHEKIREIQNRT
jgi:hypothetical protein